MAKLQGGTVIYGPGTIQTTLLVQGTTNATSTTTGALQVYGGAGIGGNLYVLGNIVDTQTGLAYGVQTTGTTSTFVISNITNSSSTSTGALQVFGGAGIGGGLFVGGTATATNFILNGYQVSTGTSSSAGSVSVQSTITNASFYPVFVSANTSTLTSVPQYTTSSFSINPSTGVTSLASLAVTGGASSGVVGRISFNTVLTSIDFTFS